MKLFRAAQSPYLNPDTTAFAEARETAHAYTFNPNFGGPRVYEIEVEVDMATVLDTVDGAPEWLLSILPLHEDLGSAIGGFGGGRARRELEARGIRWVRLVDSYPAGAITMLLIGSDDSVEDAMIGTEETP